jgi:NIPSNAP
MEIELCVVEVETERRWNWREWFDANARGVLAKFLSYRSDETFAWLQTPDARVELTGAPRRVKESTWRLAPAAGSTITSIDQLARLAESPLLEIRWYRIAAGQRTRFAEFLRDRTLEPQTACGMVVYGPFEDLGDENLLAWFRGFPDLAERDRRKACFYESRLWLEELEKEAFSMIDRYDVMLVTGC